MFLTSVEKRWAGKDIALGNTAAARALLCAWHEFNGSTSQATQVSNIVVLSSSSLGSNEVVLDQLRAVVDEAQTLTLETECFADGDWNLGLLERLILQERTMFAASAESKGVVDSYEHVLRVIVPALFGDPDESAVKSLLFDQLQGRNHGIIETLGFVESLLDELASFLTKLLTVLHERDGRTSILYLRNLQWIDSYSFNVLYALITRLKHKPIFICLSMVPQAAPEWLRRRLQKLVGDLGLTVSEVDAEGVVHEEQAARVLSELDEPARAYCQLIAFANWNLTVSELETAYRSLSCTPVDFSAARFFELDPTKECRLTINPVWRQGIKRLADGNKRQIHRALAVAALQTNGKTGAATAPAHVAYQLLESCQLDHLVQNSFALGFHLFEKVGDMDGAICFYNRILTLGSRAPEQTGRLLAKLANLNFSKGQLLEASAYYDRAIAHETNPFNLALLHYQHALVFCKKLNDFDRATELINRGLAAAESITDADERRYVVARLYNAEALIHYKCGRPDVAMARLEDGNRLLSDISTRPNLASYRFFVSKNRAQVYDRCFNDFQLAITHYRNCLNMARGYQQKYNEVLALLLLGRTYAGHHELTEANACFDEALTIAADKTQFLPVPQLYQFVVRVFSKLNLEDLALFWIDKLATFYVNQHRMYDAIVYLQQKAKQYYDNKSYDEAEWCFESSLLLLDKHTHSGTSWPQLSLNAHVYLGFIYQLKQNLALARVHLRKALAVVPSAERQVGRKNLRGPTERLASFLNHG